MLKRLLTVVLAAGSLTSLSAMAVPPPVVATFDGVMNSYRETAAIPTCHPPAATVPDSYHLDLYDDGTFAETVTVSAVPTTQTGYWTQYADRKIALIYSGDIGARTGSWGNFFTKVEQIANAGCGGISISVLPPTLVDSWILSVGKITTQLDGSGLASAQDFFKAQVYGYDNTNGNPGKKGTYMVKMTGVFTVAAAFMPF